MSKNPIFVVVMLLVGLFLIYSGISTMNTGKEVMFEYGEQLEDIEEILEQLED